MPTPTSRNHAVSYGRSQNTIKVPKSLLSRKSLELKESLIGTIPETQHFENKPYSGYFDVSLNTSLESTSVSSHSDTYRLNLQFPLELSSTLCGLQNIAVGETSFLLYSIQNNDKESFQEEKEEEERRVELHVQVNPYNLLQIFETVDLRCPEYYSKLLITDSFVIENIYSILKTAPKVLKKSENYSKYVYRLKLGSYSKETKCILFKVSPNTPIGQSCTLSLQLMLQNQQRTHMNTIMSTNFTFQTNVGIEGSLDDDVIIFTSNETRVKAVHLYKNLCSRFGLSVCVYNLSVMGKIQFSQEVKSMVFFLHPMKIYNGLINTFNLLSPMDYANCSSSKKRLNIIGTESLDIYRDKIVYAKHFLSKYNRTKEEEKKRNWMLKKKLRNLFLHGQM